MYPEPFDYHRPTTVADALALLAEHGDDATPYAGGTELLLAMKMGFAQYGHLVDLKRIPELRAIGQRDGILSVGALATHATIAADVSVRRALPALAELCGSVANARVRAAGTIGGNLCFAEPRADPPTLLAALDAALQLKSVRGERTIPAAAFITGALDTVRAPEELLLRIDIPLTTRDVRYERVVFGHRTVAGAAVVRTETTPRVWTGCVTTRPEPLPATEARLAADPDAADISSLKQAIARDLDTLDIAADEDASADYRRHLAATVVLRAATARAEAA